MKTVSLLIGCGLLLAGPAAAQDKDKDELKKQIVGKWETTLKGSDNVEFTIKAEFKADGKLEIVVRGVPVTGTYAVLDKGKVETETTYEGKKRKVTQDVKITQDTMELKDPEGPLTRFKRVK